MFDFIDQLAIPFGSSKHIYTFAVTGMNKKINKTFISRQLANEYMYSLANKYGLCLKKVWDDNHFKTYCVTDGVKMYINRL